jgi:hypothetical protein
MSQTLARWFVPLYSAALLIAWWAGLIGPTAFGAGLLGYLAGRWSARAYRESV